MMAINNLFFVLIFVAALGCGLMSGIFFAFSNFVMKALARLRPESGIAAMQSINVVVLNPLFLFFFMGTAAACLFLAVYSLVRWQYPGSIYLLAGSLVYLTGNFVVTAAFNVPRNDMLARVDLSAVEAGEVWQRYIHSWTRWNHVRTITAFAAAALLTLGLWAMQAAG